MCVYMCVCVYSVYVHVCLYVHVYVYVSVYVSVCAIIHMTVINCLQDTGSPADQTQTHEKPNGKPEHSSPFYFKPTSLNPSVSIKMHAHTGPHTS